MILYSIIIPVYNVENYIERCVDSICNQSIKDIELILIDDGSKDNSGKVCDELAQKDSRIKVVHKENQGCSVARNTGIDFARGKYICFVDSDDEWLPGVLQALTDKIENEQEYDMLIFGAKVVNRKKELLSYDKPEDSCVYRKKEDVIEFLVKMNPQERGWGLNYIWNRAYKAEILKDNKIRFEKNLNLGEDFVFNCEVMKKISSLRVIHEAYYCYYKYFENQLTMRFRDNELERRDYIFEKQKDLYRNYNILDVCWKKCLIEEGLLTHTSLMMAAYMACELKITDTCKYVKAFLKSQHYEALREYIKWENNGVNGMLCTLYKVNNSFLIGLYFYILRSVRKIKKIDKKGMHR